MSTMDRSNSQVRTMASGLLLTVAVAMLPAGALGQGGGLDDARIAHIAVTANAIDVDLAELAQERAEDARVREFAGRMIADHTGVNEEAAALASRLGVVPTDNEVSRSLLEGAEAAKQKLGAARGAAFDRAYMAREVEYHRAVLGALDETLIPNTSNGELKALLEQARGAVAAHLAHAEELHASLGGGR